jgi:hypothetical protein
MWAVVLLVRSWSSWNNVSYVHVERSGLASLAVWLCGLASKIELLALPLRARK